MRKLSLLPLLSMALAATALVSCKAVDAMDNTTTMKNDLADMKATTGGMSGTMSGMDGRMGDLKRETMVGVGQDALDLTKHNFDSYLPPPSEILLGAKLVAENMSDEELTDYFFVRLKEFNEMSPDPDQQDMRKYPLNGYSPEYVHNFNTQQMVRGLILQAIAGQVPQPMIEKLVDEQITQGGERVPTIYAMLMLRSMFIDQFTLSKDIFNQPFNTIDIARRANEEAGYLHYLTKATFASQIAIAVPSTSFLTPVTPAQTLPGDSNYEEMCVHDVKPDNAPPDWQPNPNWARDPSCDPQKGTDPGSALYNAKLDPTMDQNWWQTLALDIAGGVDCNGIKHKPKLPADQLKGGAPNAHEYAEIQQNALRNIPACPKK